MIASVWTYACLGCGHIFQALLRDRNVACLSCGGNDTYRVGRMGKPSEADIRALGLQRAIDKQRLADWLEAAKAWSVR